MSEQFAGFVERSTVFRRINTCLRLRGRSASDDCLDALLPVLRHRSGDVEAITPLN